jgi:hypothetical protein
MIRDRGRGTVVGEVATGKSTMLGGAAARNGRYLMSTATPVGRDATAIENCWGHSFPIAPDLSPSQSVRPNTGARTQKQNVRRRR